MARSAIDRFTGEASDKLEQIHERLQHLATYIPSSKDIRSYLPQREPKRGIGLPIALALGGLAFLGAITLLSTTSMKTVSTLKPMRTKEPKNDDQPPSKPSF